MFNRDLIVRKLPLLLLFISIVLFVLSIAGISSDGDMERMARVTRYRIEKRLELLEQYIDKAIDPDTDDYSGLETLPEDMVIYKYVNDSLKSWSNQFSVLNDDISSKMVFQRLTNLKNRLISPLADVTEELSYMNLGPKWYLVWMTRGDANEKVIAGIEIKNTLIDDIRLNENGINKHLKVPVHGMAHSFTDLDKAVIQVVSLVSFL